MSTMEVRQLSFCPLAFTACSITAATSTGDEGAALGAAAGVEEGADGAALGAEVCVEAGASAASALPKIAFLMLSKMLMASPDRFSPPLRFI
jgi:hypothetical protein